DRVDVLHLLVDDRADLGDDAGRSDQHAEIEIRRAVPISRIVAHGAPSGVLTNEGWLAEPRRLEYAGPQARRGHLPALGAGADVGEQASKRSVPAATLHDLAEVSRKEHVRVGEHDDPGAKRTPKPLRGRREIGMAPIQAAIEPSPFD